MGFVVYALAWLFLGWMCWRTVQKTGINPAWSLLGLVPFVNIVALWVFAYARWPALDRS